MLKFGNESGPCGLRWTQVVDKSSGFCVAAPQCLHPQIERAPRHGFFSRGCLIPKGFKKTDGCGKRLGEPVVDLVGDEAMGLFVFL